MATFPPTADPEPVDPPHPFNGSEGLNCGIIWSQISDRRELVPPSRFFLTDRSFDVWEVAVATRSPELGSPCPVQRPGILTPTWGASCRTHLFPATGPQSAIPPPTLTLYHWVWSVELTLDQWTGGREGFGWSFLWLSFMYSTLILIGSQIYLLNYVDIQTICSEIVNNKMVLGKRLWNRFFFSISYHRTPLLFSQMC